VLVAVWLRVGFSSSSWLPIPLFFSFFFYSSRHLRALHSFPTRRSSDLGGPALPDAPGGDPQRHPEGARGLGAGCARAVARELPRSEEHTSELQSPCKLVCRLLPEKKKRTVERLAPSTVQYCFSTTLIII